MAARAKTQPIGIEPGPALRELRDSRPELYTALRVLSSLVMDNFRKQGVPNTRLALAAALLHLSETQKRPKQSLKIALELGLSQANYWKYRTSASSLRYSDPERFLVIREAALRGEVAVTTGLHLTELHRDSRALRQKIVSSKEAIESMEKFHGTLTSLAGYVGALTKKKRRRIGTILRDVRYLVDNVLEILQE